MHTRLPISAISWPALRTLDARPREPVRGGRVLRLAPAVGAVAAAVRSATAGVGLAGRDPAGGGTAGSRGSSEGAAVAGLVPATAGGWAGGPNARGVGAPRVAGGCAGPAGRPVWAAWRA